MHLTDVGPVSTGAPSVVQEKGDTAAYHQGRRRRHWSCHDGAYDPFRHWQHRHAAGAVRVSRWASGIASALGAAAEGGRGTSDHTIIPPTPPPPLHPLLTPRARTHESWPFSTRGQAQPNHGIPQPHFIPLDQPPPPRRDRGGGWHTCGVAHGGLQQLGGLVRGGWVMVK